MRKTRQIQVSAWGISAVVVGIAIVAWGQGYGSQLSRISVYQIFPLFGLLAFSLMWSHYIASALRQHFKLEPKVLHDYFEITSAIVLAAILLHPGLLAWQLWRDGLGLPLGSYKEYIGPGLYAFVLLGGTAWAIFLAYEFRRTFAKRPWWKYVQYASDIAMFFIFFHALKLGGELQKGWFRYVWYFYGVTLATALLYAYAQKYRQRFAK